MSNQPDYTAKDKLEVLELVRKLGNVSKAAEQSGVSRGSIYKWQGQEDKLREQAAKSEVRVTLADKAKVRKSVAEQIKTVEDLDAVIGSMEDRRMKEADKIEGVLIHVIDLLENHPELDQVHPKDLARIMTELNTTKDKLRREPDYIIEYRSSIIKIVLQVLRDDFLNDSQIREFVDKVEQVEEAQYEII